MNLLLSICGHVGGLLPLLLLLLLPYSTYATLVDSNEDDTTNNSMMVNMVGGYKSVSIQDEGVMDAADFVFETLKTSSSPNQYNSLLIVEEDSTTSSYEIIQASQQIVAGINYQLTIMIINIDGNNNNEGGSGSSCIGAFDVTVYDQFGKTRSVTNWGDELTCNEAFDIRSKNMKGATEEKEYYASSSEEEDAI